MAKFKHLSAAVRAARYLGIDGDLTEIVPHNGWYVVRVTFGVGPVALHIPEVPNA